MELKPLDPNKYLNVTRLRTQEEVDTILMPWFQEFHELGWDIETTFTKQFWTRKTRSIQFGNKDRQFVLDLLDFCDRNALLLAECQGEYGKNLFAAPKLQKLLKTLKPILCSNKWLKVGVNLGFEFTQFYYGFGMATWGFYGCDMVERVIWAGEHSLKHYEWFSMESMVERYYAVSIDKSLQTSFDLETPLTPEQIVYAALDTRLPLAIKHRQLYGYPKHECPSVHIPGIIEDDLEKICQIENDAIGSFEQFHIHGEKIDREKWTKRIDGLVAKAKETLDKLDSLFIPVVGSVDQIVTDQMVDEAMAKWKAIKDTKDVYRAQLKKFASDLGKERTRHKKLINECQGKALINYESTTQVKNVLKTKFAGLEKLKTTDDGELKKYEGLPVIDTLRDYRELAKQISTYGYAWAKEWVNRPCNDEGWLSPYDGKLHSVYNQLEAETGRSSSDNPNGQNILRTKEVRQCFIAEVGMVYVTCDMSGAELRIIAELAKAKTWIDAFSRGEDVHSVCCEIIFPHEWPLEAEANCAYYKLGTDGKPAHQKCDCPKHKARREITKSTNFMLCYGGVAQTLAERCGIPVEEAEHNMAIHQEKFPDIWAYLEKSGKDAVAFGKSFDIFGRRRRFATPNREKARQKMIDYWTDTITLDEVVAEKNIQQWMLDNNSKKRPTGDVKFWLCHREPTERELNQAIRSMKMAIERAGKNHPIQASNVSIAKLAMGAGYDPNGKPYLFHILPQYNARLVKFVHDELVAQCPPEYSKQVAFEISDAFRRAAAERMTEVIMESEFKIAQCWAK